MKLSTLIPISGLITSILANVITTTLTNTLEERSYAIVEQETFINTVLLDALQENNKYQSVMQSKGIEFPPELMQFYIQLNTYEVDNFATSLFIQSFPFDQFATFITNFDWLSTYMNELSMTEFKVPNDYHVMTITNNDLVSSSQVVSTSRISSIPSSTASILSHSSSTISSATTSSSSSNIVSSISSTSQANGNIITPYVPHAIFLTIMALLA